MDVSFSTKHYLWMGNVIVLGLVIWSAVSLSMSILGHRLESDYKPAGPVETGPSNAPSRQSLAHYETITRLNIFGGAGHGETLEGETAPAAPAQTSAGNLRLRGTIVDEVPARSAAILEDADTSEQNLYRPGDRIGSTELLRVERDSVILRIGGRDVRLGIYLEDSPQGPAGAGPLAPLPGPVSALPGSSQSLEGLVKQTGPQTFTISRQNLGNRMKDLSGFLSDVLIQPYFKEGQPYGYVITSVKNGSPIQGLGIRQGDVVLEVNGVSVSKPEDLINLYRQVMQLESVRVKVERQGSPLTLTYFLR